MKMKQNKFLLILFVLFFAVILVACGGAEEETQTTNDSEGEEEAGEDEPRHGGNLTFGYTGEPDSLNPLYTTSAASINGFRHILATLVKFNEDGEAIGDLAEDWELSDDGLTLTFELREDVKWHDGEDFTANDVKFTFDVAKHDDYTGPRSSVSRNFEEINVIDDYTVEFVMDEPNYMILRRVNPYYILPEHILGDTPIEDLEEHEFNRNPVGVGPFKFEEWKSGQHMILTANEDYYEGEPYLDTLTLKFVPDSNALMAQFKAGDVDFVSVDADDLSEAEQLVSEGVAKLHEQPGLAFRWIAWNNEHRWFKDKEIRQAMTQGIDREEIVEYVLDGKAEVLHMPQLPFNWAYSEDAPTFDYDPEAAKEKLANAGWTETNSDGYLEKDGEEFAFEIMVTDGNKTYQKVAEVVQAHLKEIGVKVSLKVLELSALQDAASAPDFEYDAYIMGLSRSIDPSVTSLFHTDQIEGGLNRVQFSNDRVDELGEKDDGTVDQDTRQEYLQEISNIVAEEQPYTFLFYPLNQTLYTDKLEGTSFAIGVTHRDIHKWWLKE